MTTATPPRRRSPVAPVTSISQLSPRTWRVELVREGVHRVLEGDVVVGFVEEVGAVFVALSGARLARAVEVAQTLDFDAAVRATRRSARAVASQRSP